MNQAERIIDKFGGLTATARHLGHKNVSTVQGWKERGVIPQKQHQSIFDAARKAGIDVTASDFLLIHDESGV